MCVCVCVNEYTLRVSIKFDLLQYIKNLLQKDVSIPCLESFPKFQ